MGDHEFKIGQTVSFRPRIGPGAGVYQTAHFLPAAGDDEQQYRIKSDTESHLRAAKESELTALKPSLIWQGRPS
jgi:hypothetical protein